MYHSRQSNVSDPEEEEEQQQLRSRPTSAQYPGGLNLPMQNWQDPSMYYAAAATAQSTQYLGQGGLSANFPVGAAYNPELGWMEQYSEVPSEISNPASGRLTTGVQSGITAPGGTQQVPIVPSQRRAIETGEVSASGRPSVAMSDPSQPGSSSAAVAASQISRRLTPAGRHSSRSRLEEENRLLLDLRDRQRLPWREVTRYFEQTYGREYRMPTLQMRYGRLKSSATANRTRQWTDADTEALRQACQWYHEERWRIISERMQHYGASEQWTPEECAAFWRQMTSGGQADTAEGGGGS